MKSVFVVFLLCLFLSGCCNRPTEFSSTGNALGGTGQSIGQLISPAGLVFREFGDTIGTVVMVADAGNNRIQIWRYREKNPFVVIGGSGIGPGEFNHPTGITSTPIFIRDVFADPITSPDSIFIFVTDTWNHRVQQFDIQGNFLHESSKQNFFLKPEAPYLVRIRHTTKNFA